MTDYGTDLSLVNDLTPTMAEVNGRTGLAEAIARRLTCPKGRLLDDPDYGIDLRDWLNEGFTQADLAQKVNSIDAEILKEERILSSVSAAAIQTLQNGINTVMVTVSLVDGSGPFTLTLSVNNVSVDVLQVG